MIYSLLLNTKGRRTIWRTKDVAEFRVIKVFVWITLFSIVPLPWYR